MVSKSFGLPSQQGVFQIFLMNQRKYDKTHELSTLLTVVFDSIPAFYKPSLCFFCNIKYQRHFLGSASGVYRLSVLFPILATLSCSRLSDYRPYELSLVQDSHSVFNVPSIRANDLHLQLCCTLAGNRVEGGVLSRNPGTAYQGLELLPADGIKGFGIRIGLGVVCIDFGYVG